MIEPNAASLLTRVALAWPIALLLAAGCSPSLSGCDVMTNEGCPSGLRCMPEENSGWSASRTLCTLPGQVGEGGQCKSSAYCQTGLLCDPPLIYRSNPGVCRKVCTRQDLQDKVFASSCGGQGYCTPFYCDGSECVGVCTP